MSDVLWMTTRGKMKEKEKENWTMHSNSMSSMNAWNTFEPEVVVESHPA